MLLPVFIGIVPSFVPVLLLLAALPVPRPGRRRSGRHGGAVDLAITPVTILVIRPATALAARWSSHCPPCRISTLPGVQSALPRLPATCA